MCAILTWRVRGTTCVLLAMGLVHVPAAQAIEDCIPVDAKFANGVSKIGIDKPGHYCLTEDLHARVEFADHPAEAMMIQIWASDVTLDLKGHTLGRGRVFKNPGGYGIQIAEAKYTNILIKNGTLQDFDFGIYRSDFPTIDEVPVYDSKTNTYAFPIADVVLENLTFKNNKKNFQIRIPHKTPPANPKHERRRKSQYPPCGGTDDFGRPMGKDQPCDDGK